MRSKNSKEYMSVCFSVPAPSPVPSPVPIPAPASTNPMPDLAQVIERLVALEVEVAGLKAEVAGLMEDYGRLSIEVDVLGTVLGNVHVHRSKT